MTSPGVNGNLVYLGFHPYFVERAAFVYRDRGSMAVIGKAKAVADLGGFSFGGGGGWVGFGPRVQSRVEGFKSGPSRPSTRKDERKGVLLTLFDVRDEFHSIREHRSPHLRQHFCAFGARQPFRRFERDVVKLAP